MKILYYPHPDHVHLLIEGNEMTASLRLSPADATDLRDAMVRAVEERNAMGSLDDALPKEDDA